MNFSWKLAGAAAAAVLGATLFAPATMAQSTGKLSAQEQKNQDIAIKEMKDILQYGHVELAEKYMASGYIQHNPNVPQGRQAFVNFFGPRAKPEPIKDEWKNKPALILTSGDIVFFLIDREAKDPADPTKTYHYNWFDMLRVDDGMIQEHWDAAKKTAPVATAAK